MAVLKPKLKSRDIEIRRGDTFSETHTLSLKSASGTLTPIDITGYTFLGQIRESSESADVLATFTITITDAEEGEFEVVLSAATTAALETVTMAVATYNIQYTTPAGVVKTIDRGMVTFESDTAR